MRAFHFLVAIGFGLSSADTARADYDLAARPVLASADVVRPLGRIGAVSVAARGIDAGGRLLLHADLSDGTRGLFRSDGTQLETLWRSDADDQPLLYPFSAVTSPGGRVVGLGLSLGATGLPGVTDTLFLASPRPLRPLVSLGDQTITGDTITYLYEPAAVADDGTVAILAYVFSDADSDGSPYQAALLVRDDGVHLVAGEGPAVPAERRFDSLFVFGLSADGSVLVETTRYGTGPSFETSRGIYAAGPETIRPIVVDGDRSPSGPTLRQVRQIAAAPGGEVLLSACEDVPPVLDDEPGDDDALGRLALCNVYRTDNNRLVRVASGADRTPEGYRFLVDSGSLTDTGDAVLQASWLDERLPEPQNDPLFSGLLLYPAGGGSRLIAAPARGGHSNAAGEVVVTPLAGEQSRGLFRWRDARLTPIVDAESGAPGGARFIAGGLPGPRCLAADGRTASFSQFVDGEEALVCTDAGGPKTVVRLAELPQGSGFDTRQCAFPDGEEIVFSARDAIFRAGASGVGMVVGAGLVTDRGAVITALDRYVGPFRNQTFAVNPAGTIVARAHTADGLVLVRQRRGGPLEQIALDLNDGGETVAALIQAEVADDDSVLALARLGSDPLFPDNEATAVVAYDRNGGRILFRAASLGGPLSSLWVRGSLAAFTVDRGAKHYVYDLRAATLRTILERTRYPELASDPFLLDFASTGDAVFFGYANEGRSMRNGWWLLDGERIHLLASDESANQPTTDPVALNAAGNILFEALSSPSGAGVQLLTLSGPPANGRCPKTASRSSEPGHGGCQIGVAGGWSGWPLAPFALLLLLPRRRSPRRPMAPRTEHRSDRL